MIPEKLRTNFVRRTIPKTGPFPTDRYNSGQGEVAVDLTSIATGWNLYAYPLLLSLPRGLDETRWPGALAVPEPLVEGLDGDTVFLKDDVSDGLWWNADNLRPATIYEAALKLNGYIDDLRSQIGNIGTDLIVHATTHYAGASDEVTVENLGTAGVIGTVPQSDGLGGLVMVAAPAPGLHAAMHSQGGGDDVNAEDLATISVVANQLLVTDGIGGWFLGNPAPTAHAASHEDLGADEMDVTGLSGLLGDAQTPLAHAASHSILAGTDALELDDLGSTGAGAGEILSSDGAGNAAWVASSGVPVGTGVGNTLYWNGGAWTESILLLNDGTDVSIRNELRIMEDTLNGNNYVGFQAPPLLAGDQIWTLPNADGNANDVMKTDGFGNLTWVAPAGGSGMTTYVTVAAAEAAAGVDNDLCYVVETDSVYRYEAAAGGYIREGLYILNTGDAGATRWLAQAGKYNIFKVHGRQAMTLATGAAVTVNFLPAMPSTNYNIHILIEYTGVGVPSQYAYSIDAGKTVTSFPVVFSGAIDGTYDLHWTVEAD